MKYHRSKFSLVGTVSGSSTFRNYETIRSTNRPVDRSVNRKCTAPIKFKQITLEMLAETHLALNTSFIVSLF
jgi:hypothetical protein